MCSMCIPELIPKYFSNSREIRKTSKNVSNGIIAMKDINKGSVLIAKSLKFLFLKNSNELNNPIAAAALK